LEGHGSVARIPDGVIERLKTDVSVQRLAEARGVGFTRHGGGVWNGAALGTTPEAILCEALIDTLTFWCAGYRNVRASYGVEGFIADHRAVFKQCGIQRVLINSRQESSFHGMSGAHAPVTQ
jgi:hypothetical protein